MKASDGIIDARFLRTWWQRAPWYGRDALPAYSGALSRDTLFALSRRDDVESRLVIREGRRWCVAHGPFAASRLARLPARNWTLLVNGVDLHLPAMRALADRFRMIPWARHDDVMASYAAPGGGVGPHFDNYDVFLVQAQGHRRWRLSRQRDLTLLPGAPLKLLRRMRAGRTWTAAPGDVLYLPPCTAHDGVALEPCITLSVGFRTPDAQELAARFLDYLHERLALEGRYAGPHLAPASHPGRLPAPLVAHTARSLARIRWRTRDVADFLGCYLSEPKAHVVFTPPACALPRAAFARAAVRHGVALDLKSRLLYTGSVAYLNGEALRTGAASTRALLRTLGDRRALPPQRFPAAALALLHDWYRAGYVRLGNG